MDDQAVSEGVQIRPVTLNPGPNWEPPTTVELREVLRLTGFTGSEAASYLGMTPKSGGRTIRKWVSGKPIPFPAWALLVYKAGFGIIWEQEL